MVGNLGRVVELITQIYIENSVGKWNTYVLFLKDIKDMIGIACEQVCSNIIQQVALLYWKPWQNFGILSAGKSRNPVVFVAYSDRTLTGPGTGCILSWSIHIAMGRGTSIGTNYKVPFLQWRTAKMAWKPICIFPPEGYIPFPLVVWNIQHNIQ